MDKTFLRYKVMIRQPNFVTQDIVERAFEIVKKKKPHILLDEVCFEEIEDGRSVQILHIGPYDNEPKSFQKMKDFMASNNLKRNNSCHREIYLSDARKVSLDKVKTLLRYTVE